MDGATRPKWRKPEIEMVQNQPSISTSSADRDVQCWFLPLKPSTHVK